MRPCRSADLDSPRFTERVIYLNFFAPELVSGGIKMCYRSVELLCAAGYDAMVWQPLGKATWLESHAPVMTEADPRTSTDDILVFPEIPHATKSDVLPKCAQSSELSVVSERSWARKPRIRDTQKWVLALP
jgi:hypothetical protein